ncbi:MFS transporter [Rhizobium sp. SSA_523]|uniref:MFS transporter n=1 Tax=Rhizobium sp. SSA_523 TaxID=2952477 RepID=UPI00209044A4|nr:MFS transporter [Rhizobium sp. SSA_523]MCO5732149.1 MFS transporter [Rhizobium sp. SSA_523]WKC21436.1 MFS transporter [Rhizobium sp. SSA_523]
MSSDTISPSTPSAIGTAQETANWPAVAALAFGLFSLVTTELLPIGVITPMALELGVSEGAAGQAITATALIAAAAGPLLVLGSGRLDRQRVLRMLGVLFVIATLLAAFATSLPMLLAARAILGVALGGSWAMAMALTMRLVPIARLPRALAVIFTGVSVANVIAPPLAAYLSQILSWRAAFGMAAILAFVALAAQVLTIPRLPTAVPPSLASFRATLARPAVLTGLATVFFVMCGNTAGLSFVRPFLETGPQLDVQSISLALLTFGVAGFAGNLVGGVLASKSPALTAAGGALVVAGGTLLLTTAEGPLLPALAAIAIWGLGFGAFPVAISSWNAQAAPDHAESAGAMLSTGFQLAIASGAVIGGLALEGFGFAAPIYVAALAAASGAAVMVMIGRPSERRRKAE